MDDSPPHDFLARAEELTDALYADIQSLRRADALPARERRALVDKTFRHAHTFKGTAATFPQLAAASRLAHELESLLAAVRSARIAPGETVLDACEDAADSLSRAVEAAARRVPAPDATEIVERLRRLATASDQDRGEDQNESRRASDASSRVSDAASRAPLDQPRDALNQPRDARLLLPEEIDALLNADERRRIAQACAEGAHLMLCEVAFDLSDFDEKFRRLTDALAASAEIVSTLPAGQGTTATGRIGFRLLCAADDPRKLFPLATEFGAQLTELSPENENLSTAISADALSRDASPHDTAPDNRAASLDDDAPHVEASEATPSSSFVRVQLSELDDLIFAANELFDDAMRAFDAARVPQHSMNSVGASDPSSTGHSNVEDASASAADSSSTAARASSPVVHVSSSIAHPSASQDSAARVRQNLVALVERVMALRMQTLARTLERAARAARTMARRSGKRIEFEIEGSDARVDRAVAERLAAPLEHLLRNAVAHGIESPSERRKLGKDTRGHVRVTAATEGSRVRVTVADDGRGVDASRVEASARAEGIVIEGARLTEEQALRLIFRPGFSTANEISHAAGRGVGLDAVEHEIESAGGEVRVRTLAGHGTTFELRLPLALALVHAVVVRAGAHAYALDAGRVVETFTREPAEVNPAGTRSGERRQAIRWRDSLVPLVALGSLLGRERPETNDDEDATREGVASHVFVIVRAGDSRASDLFDEDAEHGIVRARGGKHSGQLVAVAVDQLLGQREVLVRTLGRHATRWRGVAGAIDLRDGTVALMLDLSRLLEG
ncbi:MAG: two-component system, chemotaxis family, sensor kinase CheA [Acidobacteriota bacterium]|nr:two-component system, chemotaxis family, sensor kinase CheA [Acidobacteriota bacterium]